MDIGVIGINHKLADLKLRESFAKICHQRFSSCQFTYTEEGFVLLNTCNRTEVYFSSGNLAGTQSYILNILRRDLGDIEEKFDQKLYSYFGHDCFYHLARVTAGLDSAIAAETEIQGQVKAAYEKVAESFQLPKDIHYLFQKSLKIGKGIRTDLPLGRGLPDIEHAIINAGSHLCDTPEKSKLLIVGVSDINRKILSFFEAKNFQNITICNRSPGPAKALAEKNGLKVLGWNRLQDWVDYDWILFGTKSPDYLISKKDLVGKPMSHKLIIDLCVPRNVDPALGRHPDITLLNIDQINRTLNTRRQRMMKALLEAEGLVHSETKRQIELFREKELRRDRILAVSM